MRLRLAAVGLLWSSACAPAPDREGGASALTVTSAKGGVVLDEGGGRACGPQAAEHVAAAWDELPIPAGSPLYTRVVVAMVTRASGSVTNWFQDPIRIEIASYQSCETIELVLVHELGHALRALYLGPVEWFPASTAEPSVAGARAEKWATLVGAASWDDAYARAVEACGLADDHCDLPLEELFAETIRGLLYRRDLPTVWCEGATPCWIYGFYEAFPDPRSVEGFAGWWRDDLGLGELPTAP
jgi:hypothetical protein